MNKFLHFVNLSSQTLYIALCRNAAQLEIHLYTEPDKDRLKLRPMQRLPIDAVSDVEACIQHGKLHYAIIGHCSSVELLLPATTKPDGPVFKFFDKHTTLPPS